MTAAPRPAELVQGFVHLATSDQGGRPDGMQVQAWGEHVYVGHVFSGGFSVLDLADPRRPRTVGFHPAPARTWTIHLQAADDLLLVIHARDLFGALPDESRYYAGSVGERLAGTERDWSAGIAVYDLGDPAHPRQVSFLPVDGVGVHRIWYTGGRYAYASVLPDGFSDYVLRVVDLADPTRPQWRGELWLPGMNRAAGERATWDEERYRYALHHAIVSGTTAYACWRDGGLSVLDVADPDRPAFVAHRSWAPPFGGGTHTALPLPGRELLVVLDEAIADDLADGLKHIWVFDVREPSNPVSVSTFPVPDEDDYAHKGRHFGPHNLHENRPGTFVSEELVFATYQNAGLRAVDVSDPYRPRQVGAFVPGPPEQVVDPRPGGRAVVQTTDVLVRADGIVLTTDYNGGLDVLEWTGG